MWFVVSFDDEAAVEVVCSNWLDGSTCWWPPRGKSSLEKCPAPSPEDGWKKYDINIMGGPYDNLLKAKRKCRQAEHTSDLNSEVDNFLHKKSRRKKSDTSSDCESEPEVEVEAPTSLTKKRKVPSPRKEPTSSLKKTSNKVVDEVKNLRKDVQSLKCQIEELKELITAQSVIVKESNRQAWAAGPSELNLTPSPTLLGGFPLETIKDLDDLEDQLKEDAGLAENLLRNNQYESLEE